MRFVFFLSLALCWAMPIASAGELRSLSQVVFIGFHEANGVFDFPGDTSLLFAVWSDGHIVWSADQLNGNGPYRKGQVDPGKVKELLSRFEKEGLFAYKRPDTGKLRSPYQLIDVKFGKKVLNLASSHELIESAGGTVDDQGRLSPEGSRRIDVLVKSTEYLKFRLIWTETRNRITGLFPLDSKPVGGRLILKNHAVYWQEEE